ncbi:hypothetical protein SAMN05443529_103142 [Desulfosporosinus hippei DSM 8344]|uniref:Uncharacterized protein n=1 Tax=Desulfosporosinus hippei DSM 8344 TaxID=1121419 RepID=A0A1G7UH80_9FIRM|nr:hypothetical protein SAMN05443529_103142 [Desulfosporosinus hippei DSM 8344]
MQKSPEAYIFMYLKASVFMYLHHIQGLIWWRRGVTIQTLEWENCFDFANLI